MGDGCATLDAPRTTQRRLSVQEIGRAEAERHKWIESEKAGRDLGDHAIRLWVREHWHTFLRERWLEHIQGRTYWIELDQGDFGLLQGPSADHPLIDEIVDRLKDGWENLTVIQWAIEEGLPCDEVLDILESLDINSRRIECLLVSRLSQGG